MTLTLAAAESVRGAAGTGSAITYTISGMDLSGATAAYKTLAQGQLPTVAAAIYTASGVQAIIKHIALKNTTAGNVAVTMYVNGVGAANALWSGIIPANGSATFDGKWTVYDASGFAQTAGATGPAGTPGTNGTNGYSPILDVQTDGNRRVLRLQSWTGGTGGTPAGAGQYLSVAGLDPDIADGVDIRGPQGLQGNPGTPGEVTTAAMQAYAQPLDSDLTAIAALTTTAFGRGRLAMADAAAATAELNIATPTLKGLLSANDKKIIDDLHYDVVADYGWIGNDSNDNGTGAGGATAFSGIMSSIPTGARLFFPAGTYRTSVELTINVDKRITFQGVNRYASVIKTTSATAHIFHKSVAGWYDSFQDLGFQSSVTRTAGAAIYISAGNNVGMNCYRLWMTGMFKGIWAEGNQSANLSVWSDLDISGITNGGRGLHINGATINLMIHNATINAGGATTSACCEINQSGAVQVTGCDWIMGTNVVLINSTAGAGPQACYFTNCFFDQPAEDVIKIIGTNTANRIKFTQCGIATSSGGGAFSGILIAGTGAGAVGTSTALPAGISVVDCDIYHQAGNGTGAGIRINGAQDVNIQNTRITGWGGSGGCGIRATPSAGSVTSVRVNGCILGPNSNLTIINSTGIQLDAGNFGRISISDNGIYGWTVAGIADSATTTYTNQKNIADNDGAGLISGTIVARTTTLSVANTETEVIGFTAQGNVALKPGMVLRFQASGIQTNTTTASSSVWRIRIGPTTLTGAVVASWTVAMGTTARTNVPFYVVGQVTILSTTTAIATLSIRSDGLAYAAPTTTITAAVTIATGPADQRVQLTVISGAASTTWNTFAAEVQAVVA